MKLTNLMVACASVFAFTALAQPTDSQVISEVKAGNSQITKVTIGSKDSRLENGIRKHYVTYSAYINTEYTGIQRVYRSQRRYVGNKLEKNLVGDNYYTGIPNPKKAEIEELLNNNKTAVFGGQYSSLAQRVCNPTNFSIDESTYHWGNLNGCSFNAEITYFIKKDNNLVEKIKKVLEIHLTRSTDGSSWNPKAKLLPEGKWILGEKARRLEGTSKSEKIIESSTYSEEDYNKLKSITQLESIEKAQAYLSKLPKVTLPKFNNDKHAIQYLHELMIEGDKGKIEAVLNEMCPDSYFTDRSNYLYTNQGADFVNKIVDNSPMYTQYFCKNPQIKAEQYGIVQFYIRDLTSFGRISVYQSKDLKWRVQALEFPYGTGERLENAKKAGDTKCGTPLDTDAPEAVVKYAIGDRINGQVRGKWYAGTVEKIDNMMDDRYYVKFDAISGQWITADSMQKGGTEKVKTTTVQPASNSTQKTETETPSKTVKNTKSKLNGLKGKIKLP